MWELNAALSLGCFEVAHVPNPEPAFKIERESTHHIIPPNPNPMAHPETFCGERVAVGSHPHLIEQQAAVIFAQVRRDRKHGAPRGRHPTWTILWAGVPSLALARAV